jgi:hypothetical protein
MRAATANLPLLSSHPDAMPPLPGRPSSNRRGGNSAATFCVSNHTAHSGWPKPYIGIYIYGQNHVCIYGHVRCIPTVLANLKLLSVTDCTHHASVLPPHSALVITNTLYCNHTHTQTHTHTHTDNSWEPILLAFRNALHESCIRFASLAVVTKRGEQHHRINPTSYEGKCKRSERVVTIYHMIQKRIGSVIL